MTEICRSEAIYARIRCFQYVGVEFYCPHKKRI
nr:MAG TPA: hypothetical protein [Caudoviricetes sp.]